ncbi:MAG: hypothetical protein LUQ41_00250 [Methanomicrobiales archaeon]|nr:hypothetical protein [Methanomicrobiales archaeon]
MAMRRSVSQKEQPPERETAAAVKGPDLSGLSACIRDAKQVALATDTGPAEPTDYADLRRRLVTAEERLPPLYRDQVSTPFRAALDRLGKKGFASLLSRDPEREGEACLMLDIAQAILQNGERYEDRATDGFQEVVSDLYDGFLSAEDRKEVNPPDKGVIPPLVKWGYPEAGPYTWPVDATSSFGVAAAIVNLPPANARAGILAWAAIAHETSGHDIIHADSGLAEEMATKVWEALTKEKLGKILPDYWSARIDETASDVLGILNMGPAAGIGLVGYFRALRDAYGGDPVLSGTGHLSDPHPADLLRAYLAAAVIRRLSFSAAKKWAAAIEKEADRDLTTIRLGTTVIPSDDAKRSADVVAEILARTKMEQLELRALGHIQDWRDKDERIAGKLRTLLQQAGTLPSRYAKGIYAAHVVAAAVTASVAKGADLPLIFDRMLGILKVMHDRNASWGPLYVAHPGNISAIFPLTLPENIPDWE